MLAAFGLCLKAIECQERQPLLSDAECPVNEFGAISVPGVRQAVANEIVTPGNDPARYAQVYIADKDGYASIQLIANVRSALQEYRAAGIKCDVIGGSTVFQEVQIEIAFPTGVNQSQIGADVKNAIVNAVNDMHCGETLMASSIISAARSVTNAIVGRLAYPLGDVVPTDTEVIRTTYDRVSIVVIATPGNVFNNTTRAIQFGFEGGKVIPTL